MPDQLKKMCLQKLYLIAVTFDVFLYLFNICDYYKY